MNKSTIAINRGIQDTGFCAAHANGFEGPDSVCACTCFCTDRASKISDSQLQFTTTSQVERPLA